MKKVIFICLAFALAATTIFESCKKGTEQIPLKTLHRSESKLSVNVDYGFIVFENFDQIQSFTKDFVGSTHGELREYLRSIGINSLGFNKYKEIKDDEIVTDEQIPFYLLNDKGIIQIKNVLTKQVDQDKSFEDWNFFLTLVTDNLNAESYEVFAKGSFDKTIMNKFSCGQEIEGDFFEFIIKTPAGYENIESVPVKARRMFGTTKQCITQTYMNPENGETVTNHYYEEDTYFFWIHTGHHQSELSSGPCGG